MPPIELNLDGLVGPTHNYAGLSPGNVASQKFKHTISRPRDAALQGLRKMKFLADLGVLQAVLPPQHRPDLQTLRRLGFSGSDAQVVERAHCEAPELLAACYSASSMWAANAATVSPSSDTADGRVHFTPANLVSHLHRSLEACTTSRILRAIFPDEACFAHHEPLPAEVHFSDEGAANQMRLCRLHGEAGVEVFVYGRQAFAADHLPRVHPARQSLEASQSIARLHGLDANRTLFLKQNPDAIDAGVFHNDVAAVANENVLLFHELAYEDRSAPERIRECVLRQCGFEPVFIEVKEDEVSLRDAVASYLFNSQLVSMPDGTMGLICPIECQQMQSISQFLNRLLTMGTPFQSYDYIDVRQSMRNGGGPACLRLRVVLTERELARMKQSVLLTDKLYQQLADCIERRYRPDLSPADLADPKLIDESRTAVDELTRILLT